MVKYGIDFLFSLRRVQLVRFIFTGILNTAFGYSVFSFFIFCGFHYWLAGLLATVCGIFFNFKSIGTLVFASQDNSLLVRFVFVYFVIYFTNLGFMRMLELMDLNAYASAAVLLAPTALLSFLLNKFWVFGVKK